MTDLTLELHKLMLEIKAADPDERYKFQPKLERLINDMKAHGLPLKPGTKQLNQRLRDAAIEAQFNNLPI